MRDGSRVPTCWAISDGAAGNERQAVALSQAVGTLARTIRIALAQPWDLLAPRLAFGARSAIRTSDGRPIAPPWPDIAIGCGRRAALVTRSLRAWSGGAVFTVQILDPRIVTRAFDRVVAPRHDALHGANVIETIGSIHPVDRAWLAEGRSANLQLGLLPSPRTALLVGATTAAQRIDDAYLRALLERIATLPGARRGSLLVCTSRRTPATCVRVLRDALSGANALVWGGPEDGPNPYAGVLAWADRIVVTPDSVNMLSEACATGLPVLTFATTPIAGKLERFHDALRRGGHLQDWNDARTHGPAIDALLERPAVAARVREAWAARRPATTAA